MFCFQHKSLDRLFELSRIFNQYKFFIQVLNVNSALINVETLVTIYKEL